MIGAQSADIDDELEQKIVTLRDLEREYDTLEKNIVFTSLDQMEEYQVLMKSINR